MFFNSTSTSSIMRDIQDAAAVANRFIKNCDTVSKNRPEDRSFLGKLANYIRVRNSEAGSETIISRVTYLHDLILAINANDTPKQMELMEEDKIHHFKGIFSQRLYDILVERRDELSKGNSLTPGVRR